MNILIIGNGGREHALAWKISQSPQVARIFVAPGNAGTSLEPGVENIPITAVDTQALLRFALDNAIDLTIVGPELPLALGIVDLFTAHNLACFGPSQAAAQLETSKVFSKNFMHEFHIPTAKFAVFTSFEQAKAYVETQTFPLVIKADGLAGGKGVVVAQTQEEALKVLQRMLNHNTSNPQKQVIIEEFLAGEEASFIVIADGEHAIALATAQDHKTRDNFDQGPNTGGMGAYSPAPIVTSDLHEKVMQEVIYPTLKGLAAKGHPYTGFLYAGLMIMPEQSIQVLEFNCRLGDPEAQIILMRLKSDLLVACLAALQKRLDTLTLVWDERPALGVVLATKGYPDACPQGDRIQGLPTQQNPDHKVFHAGTRIKNNDVLTAGGRVLCVTALGDSIETAQKQAYTLLKGIDWGNQYYRTDIGYKAITTLKKEVAAKLLS